MNRINKISVGSGRTRVELELYEIGEDLLAVVGGEGRHVGAVTLSEGDADHQIQRTLSAVGHREAELTCEIASALAVASGRRSVTIAGIHLDHIDKSEIKTIQKNTRELSKILRACNLRRST